MQVSDCSTLRTMHINSRAAELFYYPLVLLNGALVLMDLTLAMTSNSVVKIGAGCHAVLVKKASKAGRYSRVECLVFLKGYK
jgi:hypothetical protein